MIKRILRSLADDPSFVQMFIDEAKMSALLQHPNIVQVYNLGEADGRFFIAMEYVAGHDFRRVCKAAAAAAGDALDPYLIAHVAHEVARALQYAHELRGEDGRLRGIIHRDVSPANILIGFSGAVKLLDFGIAKAAERAHSENTHTGTLKGKFAYMAPERIQGLEADGRADVFALGVVMWEALCGQRLFVGENDAHTVWR